MVKHEASIAGKAVAVTYTGGFFVNGNKQALLYVGTTGNVKVDMMDGGDAITFTGLAVGYHPLNVKRIYETGTTATNIILLM